MDKQLTNTTIFKIGLQQKSLIFTFYLHKEGDKERMVGILIKGWFEKIYKKSLN